MAPFTHHLASPTSRIATKRGTRASASSANPTTRFVRCGVFSTTGSVASTASCRARVRLVWGEEERAIAPSLLLSYPILSHPILPYPIPSHPTPTYPTQHAVAWGHTINHHRYNNGPCDVVTTADKPRDSWVNFVAFLPRWFLCMFRAKREIKAATLIARGMRLTRLYTFIRAPSLRCSPRALDRRRQHLHGAAVPCRGQHQRRSKHPPRESTLCSLVFALGLRRRPCLCDGVSRLSHARGRTAACSNSMDVARLP